VTYQTSTSVFEDGRISTHADPTFTRRANLIGLWVMESQQPRLADSSDFGLLESKVPKMWDSVPRTLMNHHAKYDAASFILGGEIMNRQVWITRCAYCIACTSRCAVQRKWMVC